MQTKKRVVIVGAGPAGLSAATELAAHQDYEVTVLDRNAAPSYKVCGGGVDSKFFKREFGADILDREFGAFYILTPKSTFPVGSGKVNFVGTLDRRRLNEVLAEKAVTAGARLCFNQAVQTVGADKVTTSTGEEFPFDYLIGADGATSIVRKSLGLPTEKFLIAYQYMVPGQADRMDFYIDFRKFGVTYSWIFPQKDIVSVGTGYAASEGKTEEQIKALRENFEQWTRERFDLENARFEGFTINYDYRGFEFGHVFLAGDAGGFASGLTGEGIKPAILSGRDIARRILDPGYECAGIRQCLRIKRREDGLLHLMIDKPFGKLVTAACGKLIDHAWFKKLVLKCL